ncbi:hypothetical protein [Gephyromycinifex aptenodytis]|uniref:hypothetical protein n=1 Tax=Gephyromycinifex aptenodytis TaxID=2716227 RepID=UPI0014460D25|nr:hypothetical protein [Gephyromycinifex aptenodytis]
MTDYLAKYSDPCVIAVRHTPHDEGEAIGMRAASLTALLAALGGLAADQIADDPHRANASPQGSSSPRPT